MSTEYNSFYNFCLNFINTDEKILIFNYNNNCNYKSDIDYFINKLNIIYMYNNVSDDTTNIYSNINFLYYDDIYNLPTLSTKPKYIYIKNLNLLEYNLIEWVCSNITNNGKILLEFDNETENVKNIIDFVYDKKYCIEYLNEYKINDKLLIRIIIQNNNFIPKPNIYFLEIKNYLFEFIELCNKNNIKIIAHSGTLLGAIRCKGIIPWDTDIDIGILYEDINKLLNILKNNNYHISSCKKYNDEFQNYLIIDESIIEKFDLINNMIWIYKDNFYIQLNIMIEDNSYKPEKWLKTEYRDDTYIVQLNEYLKIADGGRNMPKSLFYPLKKIKFYNLEIFIPNQSNIILKNWFGDNCLINYPNNFIDSGDPNRFITSGKKIEYFYAIGE